MPDSLDHTTWPAISRDDRDGATVADQPGSSPVSVTSADNIRHTLSERNPDDVSDRSEPAMPSSRALDG
jgi:hypothetical protein